MLGPLRTVNGLSSVLRTKNVQQLIAIAKKTWLFFFAQEQAFNIEKVFIQNIALQSELKDPQ
jgi:hypothetical protein